MSDINLEMKLYGAFRKFGETVSISVAAGSNIEQIKTALSETLGELVHDSAFANDNTILSNSAVLEQDTVLSILPPVCGG